MGAGLLTTDVTELFAGGFLDGEEVISVLSLTTVDLFATEHGHLIVRQYPAFDHADWMQVVALLPAGTTIDPAEWEQVFPHTEILFVPSE